MEFLPTGNEYVALPTLRAQDGALESINFLHMGFRGLVEICGSPLLQPLLEIDGVAVPLTGLAWERLGGWIPRFHTDSADLHIAGEYLAPPGERGFATRLRVGADRACQVGLGWRFCWEQTLHTINESKVMAGTAHQYHSEWSQGPVFDFRGVVTHFALAPLASDPSLETSADGLGLVEVWRRAALGPGESLELTLFWGLGLEEVGAVTAAREMERTCFQRLLDRSLRWLAERRRTTGDPELDAVLNLNLLFNQFYATGRTLDTEELVAVTSRSPRYYVSAAYWDRDALYWSFPALLISDPDHAREVLDYVFGRQGRNAGIHSRYIDGIVLEPGFELDELVAPILALSGYVAATGDRSILSESAVQAVCRRILATLASKKHPHADLYETFLLPTDDPALYPYCTYDNVLVWKSLRAAAELFPGFDSDALLVQAERVRQAIWQQCVKEGRFAWEVDLEGAYRFYDEPPGSLQMLPVHGFCTWDDPVYLATVQYVRSPAYRHAFAGTAFAELGCAHAEHPWVLSAANSLFMPFRREQARDLILRAPMDGGIACESIDEHTGECRTGAAFATCAGYLSYAIWANFGPDGEARRRG